METITLRDLRLGKDEIQRKLREQKQLILTANGRPIAVITGIDQGRVEETLAALKQARAQVALAQVRQAAQERGLDKLSEDEIETEIAPAKESSVKWPLELGRIMTTDNSCRIEALFREERISSGQAARAMRISRGAFVELLATALPKER